MFTQNLYFITFWVKWYAHRKKYVNRKDDKDVGKLENIIPIHGNKNDAVVVVKLMNLVFSNT
jgi:hypothetical protein